MTERSATISPTPPASPKQYAAMEKINVAITETFQSIRQLHTLITNQGAGDEISYEAIGALLRASWTIENAQESAQQHVLAKNKYAYRKFLSNMGFIKKNAEIIHQKCKPYPVIPFKLVAEIMLFGGDINAIMHVYK